MHTLPSNQPREEAPDTELQRLSLIPLFNCQIANHFMDSDWRDNPLLRYVCNPVTGCSKTRCAGTNNCLLPSMLVSTLECLYDSLCMVVCGAGSGAG